MKRFLLSAALVCAAFAPALAQGLPTTQPEYLQVIREEIKVGHTTDHAKVEAGWPAAFARAKSPDYYIALSSITGTPEAWFVIPYKSHAAMGEGMKRENDDPVLAQELARLSRADAEHISGARTIHAVAMKDLSHGPFPSTEKQRFWEIVQFRVRPGHEADFAAAARSYGAALGRVDPEASFRVYQVRAGMPGPSYLVFSSVTSFDGFDKQAEGERSLIQSLTAEEKATLQKFSTDALISEETQRFRLDPDMSYVSQEVRDQDPAFWKQKKPGKSTQQ
jgi:hypothetical protein